MLGSAAWSWKIPLRLSTYERRDRGWQASVPGSSIHGRLKARVYVTLVHRWIAGKSDQVRP
jgi:hypothetical protein